MENVYVIKVKTKPALSSLYPSERRYSASTVGGLSFVHFGLGALSLLLGSLALSLQGPILSVACLVPFVTGLLAWRRWYIDRSEHRYFLLREPVLPGGCGPLLRRHGVRHRGCG